MDSGKKKASVTSLYSLSERWVTKPTLNKTVSAKHEDWGIRLKILWSEAEVIKTALQAKDKDVTALDASFKEIDKKLKAITKELQKTQKLFSKKRTDIQEKLLFVVHTVESSNGILLSALKENCKKITEGLETSKNMLNEDAKRVEECEKLLKPLGTKIAKLLLPKNVETCAVESKELKDRLEAIILSTSDMTVEDAPAQFNHTTIRNHLTMLRESCASSVKLLDLVQNNVKKVFGEITEVKENKGADKPAA